jgi:hypothetical protein
MRLFHCASALIVTAAFGVSAATAAPPGRGATAVEVDPARVVVAASPLRLSTDALASPTVTVPAVHVGVQPASIRVHGLAAASVVTVTRTVDLAQLRVRLRGQGVDLTVPASGGAAHTVVDEHLVLAPGDGTYLSPWHRFDVTATFEVPAGLGSVVTATVELAASGMVAAQCPACTPSVAHVDAAAESVRSALAGRRAAHGQDMLIGSWQRAVPYGGAFAYQALDVWQLRNDAEHLSIESYLRLPDAVHAPIRVETTVGGAWTFDGSSPASWTLRTGEREGAHALTVRRPARATTADAPAVAVTTVGLPTLGGPTNFLRHTPGDGPIIATMLPADVLTALPDDVRAFAETTRDGATQDLAWGQSVPLAMTKDHDCAPDPNQAAPGEAVDLKMDCYQWQGASWNGGRDEYWSEEHTKAHTLGVIIGHSATSHCWIYSVRDGTDGSFFHTIDRCRFHNSEHGDESMSAQRNEFFNCVPEWNSCFRQSGIVPNDGWKTYDFFSCCSISTNPFNVSPAQMMSVWWTSIRAQTSDSVRGMNSVACTYVKIQPFPAVGEGGLCNYYDGISP